MLEQDILKKQATNILKYNLMDNVNTYVMQEDGRYIKKTSEGERPFNIHHEFYGITREIIEAVTIL